MFKNKKGKFGNIFFFIAIIAYLVINLFQSNFFSSKSTLEIPAYKGYVNDFSGIISTENQRRINYYLDELDKKTGAQVAVVTINSLKGNSIEAASLDIGRKWGIGQKGKNTGVVILIAVQDKKMRIEIGYGLEGIITDGKAGRIRDEYMIPMFKQGNMEQGIINGTFAVAGEIAKGYKVEMTDAFNSFVDTMNTNNADSGSSLSHKRHSSNGDAFVILFIIFMIIISILPQNRRRNGYVFFGDGFGGGSDGGGFGGFGGGSFGGGGASGGW